MSVYVLCTLLSARARCLRVHTSSRAALHISPPPPPCYLLPCVLSRLRLPLPQVLYRMAKLRHPFAASAGRDESIVPPLVQPAQLPAFPPGWERVSQVAHRCLCVDPALRPNPSAIVDLLSEILWEVPPRAELRARWARLNKLSAAIAATLKADGRLKLVDSGQLEFVYAESTEEQLQIEFIARELEVAAQALAVVHVAATEAVAVDAVASAAAVVATADI